MPNVANKESFISSIANYYAAELNYYTHPDVAVTAHQVGALEQSSWTAMLITLGHVKATPGVHKYIELERTLTSLYCFFLCDADDSYEEFVAAQPDADKLSRENFSRLQGQLKSTLDCDDNIAVIASLILYSDLGKSPSVRALAKQAGIDPRLDTDDLMAEILKLSPDEITTILPSFGTLSESAKVMLNKAYPMMKTCYGHLYFLEAGEKTLQNMVSGLRAIAVDERQRLLKLVNMAQLFDAIGAQGQLTMMGSVTCTNNFFRGYSLVLDTFYQLEAQLRDTSADDAVKNGFANYVSERASWIGVSRDDFTDKSDFDVVVRLACTLRIFSPAVAQKLKTAYLQLKPHYRHLLQTQLSLDKHRGINTFAQSPHYVASSAQNISRVAFERNDIDGALDQALHAETCFATLIRELIDNYPVEANHPRYPLSFAKLAALGSKDPEAMDATLARWALPRPVPQTVIKNLIFDLGHVFIRIDPAAIPVYEAFRQLAEREGKATTPDEMQALVTPDVHEKIRQYHLGQMTTPAFRDMLRSALKLERVSDDDFDTAWCASILDTPASVKARLQVLNQLFEAGYHIFLLSNNNEIHRLHTKRNYDGLHWGKYFLKQYYSNEIGLMKPAPEFYKKVLTENRLSAHETIFFDDIKAYVKAAWGVGIRSRQFTVDYDMSNVKVMIDAIDKAVNWAKVNTGGTLITRQSSLLFFAAQKFTNKLARHRVEVSDEKVEKVSALRK